MNKTEIEIIKFESYDIITTSDEAPEEPDPPCVQGAWFMDPI